MKKVDGKLNLWVFGPGHGELVIVHVPPDGWLSVDGCSAAGEAFGPKFFETQGVAPTHILMTHPHLDHARGIQKLVEAHTGAQVPSWPRLGVLTPPRAATSRSASQTGFDGRVANAVLNSMVTRWRRRAACKWVPVLGSVEPIGEGQLRVLSPAPGVLPAKPPKHFDWNEAATALAVEWKNQRVILGSDLVETPGDGWTSVLKAYLPAREHGTLKVAHHGSLEAQHEPLLKRKAGEPEVALVATPFANKELPRFKTGEGADLLLRHAKKLMLTGLPQEFGTQSNKPRQWLRSRLAKLRKPIAPDDAIGPFPACYVQLALDASGKTRVTYGPGSVIVHAG